MAELDSYVRAIGGVVASSESEYLASYGLNADYDIIRIISTVSQKVGSIKNEDKILMNEEVGKQIVLLSYINFRLKYHKTKRLDFSSIPLMREVAEIILLFVAKENVTNENLRLINKIVVALSKTDKITMKARYGLGYRCIRLFMLLILHESYTNASIVATFILEQIEVK